MKKINRKEYIELLKNLALSPCQKKPIMVIGKSGSGKLSIANEVLGDDFFVTQGDPLAGHEHILINDKIEKISLHPELQNRFSYNAAVDGTAAKVIMYDCRNCAISEIDLNWTLWFKKIIKKNVIICGCADANNFIPSDIDCYFDVYEYDLDKESWLEWALEKNEQDEQNVSPIITDFVSAGSNAIWSPNEHIGSTALTWVNISNEIRLTEKKAREFKYSSEYINDKIIPLIADQLLEWNKDKLGDFHSVLLLYAASRLCNFSGFTNVNDLIFNSFCKFYKLMS